MHFHLPKPLHGWREFVGEVGIIVLGVLIALAFEQGVESWHSMQEHDHLVRALASEAVAMAENAGERVGLNKCNGDRLAELAAKLNQANQHWRADLMPPSPYALKTALPSVYRVPRRSMGTDGWETAKSTGELNLLRRQERESFASLYALAGLYRQFEDEESDLAPQLNMLGFDQQLDNVSRLQALRIVARLDYLNAGITSVSAQLVERTRQMHLFFDRASASADLKKRVDKERSILGACVADSNIAF